MKRLTVYLNRDAVGTLTQDASGLLPSRYGPEWLRKPGSTPLSRSLPSRDEPVLRQAAGDDAMSARVADIVGKRSSSLL